MRAIDAKRCKLCSGQLRVYRTRQSGLFVIRYRRCVNCGGCSKTVATCYQIVPQIGLPSVAPERKIDGGQSDSQGEGE